MIPLDYLLPIATFARKLVSYSAANLNPMGRGWLRDAFCILLKIYDLWSNFVKIVEGF